ncbi:MAG: Glutamyl-tRNA reductase [Nitrosopumilales archaeon]|nr:MAG: Glutamyl-tRNA reductase [Nitrosopumilales archaeon]
MSNKNFEIINARVTFKNMPIHKIEKFSFKDITLAYEAFKKISNVSECLIIQNAFRVEVFFVVNLETGEIPDVRRTEGKTLTLNKIEETWESLTELGVHDVDHFDQTLEVYKNTDVYLHLLRLATGLDSIIVGRKEILDEIKDSISSAKQAQVFGKILDKLFESSIRIGTKIRDSTGIGKEIISIGDIAIKTTEEKTGIGGKHVLLIGTGETAAMVAKSLNQKNYAFDVTSRIIERATSFSKLLGGTPLKFEDVLAGFDKFDIIFVATTADYFVINYDILRIIMENKKKGTLLIDVSDPRAVDEKVSKFPGMKLMFRDQISELVEENEQTRMNKIPDVEKMISKEVPIIEALMKRLDPELIA